MKRNFTHPKLRQHLAEALAVLLFLSLVVPATQARRQNDQRAVGVRPTDLVNTLPDKSKRYALIIGVDKYADSSISPLDGASNDAKALADALIRYAGFPSDQVILLATDQPMQRQPTREEILLRLSNLRSAVPKDGLLLVAFAGHGIERNGQAFLLPSNARIQSDIELLQDTSISVTRMKEAIRAVGVGQVVLFLDAYRNDPASGRSDSVNPLTNAYTRGFNFDVRNREVMAFATLYATEVGKRAYEYKEKRQGYFTWALVEGLQGAAANERGEVTLSRLIRHVQEAVPKRVLLDLGRSVVQKPFAVVEGYRADELVIAITERPAPVSLSDAEVAYWNSIKDSGNPANFEAYLEDFPQGRFRRLAENRLRELEGAGNRPPIVDPVLSRSNALKPVIPLPRGVDPTRLAVHNFTTATVDAQGNVRRFAGTPTQQYTEDLGNGVLLEMVAVKGSGDIQDFWIGKFEVTQAQWRAVMGNNPSYFQGDKLPVESICWGGSKCTKEYSVEEFCERLNAKLGLSAESGYRLPKEAEWEYAARAGTKTGFAFGDTISLEIVNYNGDNSYGDAKKGIYREKTVEVGSLGAANAWGLYDMHGNVGEWCEGIYQIGASYRVHRGGGWSNSAVACRSTHRDGFAFAPGARLDFLGFRLSRTAK